MLSIFNNSFLTLLKKIFLNFIILDVLIKSDINLFLIAISFHKLKNFITSYFLYN